MTIPRGPAVLLGLGIALFFDVLRVFLPSLITLFGRAGETPAEQMGSYAALWFVLPFAAVLLRPRWSLYGGAVVLVLCRVLLQADFSQLYVASVGVSAGLFFLYGCARTLPRAAVAVGIAGGLGFSVLVHLLLDGVDLVWRDGVVPWLGVVTLCAAFLLSVRQEPSDDLAPSAAWFLLGPTLLLVGMLGLTPALSDESPAHWTSALTFGGLALGAVTLIIVTALPSGPTPRATPWWIFPALLLTVVTLDAVIRRQPLMVFGALLSTGTALALTNAQGKLGRRPGIAVLSGMALFLVATFLYFAAYDLDLGFSNTAVPIVVVVLVLCVAVVSMRGPVAATAGGVALGRSAWLGALVLALLVGATGWRSVPAVQTKAGDTFTLIAYNIRMGFGLDGRLSLDQISAWAATKKPDVVLLSEVDRGWLLNGGHDDLARIARGLGMRYYFAPAADRLWGDALLTNLPVKDIASHKLGKHDYPTGAQAQAIVLEVGGKEVGIVNTHLQAPPGQAPEVAAIVRNLAAGTSAEDAGRRSDAPMGASVATHTGSARPVILAGDLNTPTRDPHMRILEAAGLSDPLIALGDPPTSPADNPVERIDHVLITKGLTAVSAEATRVPYSDHLPVVTTLRITTVDQGG